MIPRVNMPVHKPVARVCWRDTLVAIALVTAIMFIQMVFFDDPTAVVVRWVNNHF